jgi:D-arabinose 1-dehydrogenase-like Zn-dependent alcohol dehydrogenase
VAIARGQDKEPLARELGAHEYIDSTAGDPAAALKALGGARVILATVTSGDAMSAVIPGLGRNGKLVIVGVSMDPVQVPTAAMIMSRGSVQGWPSGTAQDSTETLAFSALASVRPMTEEYPLERAGEAYDRMMSGGARFRVVLEMN